MDLSSKIKYAGFWQTTQKIIQVVAQFGYMAIMARLLTKDDFGLMALATSFISIGVLFSEAGMGAALIQRKKINQKHMNAALQGSIAVGIIVFMLLLFSSEHIAVFFMQPMLEPIIKVIGVVVILSSLSSVSLSLLQKNFKFKHTSLVTMISTIIGYSAGVFSAFRGLGVWSLIVANLVSAFLNTTLLLYLSPIRFSLKIHLKEWKELFSFGSGVILARLINRLGFSGVNLILGKIFQPAQLGVFERVNTIKGLPSGYLGDILDTIMFPAMAEVQDDNNRVFKVYQHGLGLVNTLLMPIALFFIIFAKEIVLILLGDQWLEAVIPLQIMFVVLPFTSSVRMADSVIRAKGLIYKNVYRRTVFMMVLLTTVSLGGYFYGIKGAATGVTFSYLFNYIYMLFLVKSIFNKKVKEVFWEPVVIGIKLSIFVFLLALLFITLVDGWHHDSILKFLMIFLLMGISAVIIYIKNPDFFGVYLNETIIRLFPKLKKK